MSSSSGRVESLVLAVLTGLCALVAGLVLGSSTPLPADQVAARTTGARPAALPSECLAPERSADVEQRTEAPLAQRNGVLHGMIVRGRCLDADSSAPLVGCEVWLSARARGPGSTAPLAATRADTDGCFELSVAAHAAPLRLHARAEGHADMLGDLAESPRALALGDIRIPRGVWLGCTVETEEGMPLAYIPIRLSRRVSGDEPVIHPVAVIDLESDERGEAVVPGLPAGRSWSARVGELHAALAESTLEIPDGRAREHVVLVAGSSGAAAGIQGWLVGDDGRAIDGARVEARRADGSTASYAYSEADGRFLVRGRTEPDALVALAVPEARGHEPLQTAPVFAWGSTGVVLRLWPAGELELFVLAADDGTAIEDFGVTWYHQGDLAAEPRCAHENVGHHAGGRAVVRGIPSGSSQLVVVPADERWSASAPLPLEMSAAGAALRVALARRRALTVRVTTADGAPLAGTRVELVRPADGQDLTLETPVVDSGVALPAGSRAVRLDSATTNELGLAVLGAAPASTPLTLRVLGPGHLQRLVPGVVLAAQAPRLDVTLVDVTLDVVVTRGARLVGHVAPVEVLDALRSETSIALDLGPRIRADFAGAGRPEGERRTRFAPIDAQGAFELADLEPGRWDVCFTAATGALEFGLGVHSLHLGELLLPEDARESVRFDIGELAVARLRGRILLDGVPAAGRTAQLVRVLPAGPEEALRLEWGLPLRTNEAGAFEVECVRPGLCAVALEAERGGAQLVSLTRVELQPGADVLADFAILSGRARIRLTDLGGRPACQRFVQLVERDTGLLSGVQTDDDGWAEFAPLACGTYLVRTPATTDGATLLELGDISVLAGVEPITVRLVLSGR